MFKRKSKKSPIVKNEKVAENINVSVDFKFFKCCSATLKKFSVITFVINLFVTLVVAAVGIVLIGVYIGTQMMSLLLVPIVCVVVIFVLILIISTSLKDRLTIVLCSVLTCTTMWANVVLWRYRIPTIITFRIFHNLKYMIIT